MPDEPRRPDPPATFRAVLIAWSVCAGFGVGCILILAGLWAAAAWALPFHAAGPALAERLIGQHPSLRVLYMSGYAEEAIERQGSLPAGGDLLEKPFTADQLARRVRAAIAGSAS